MATTVSVNKEERRFWTEFIDIYRENSSLWKVKSKEYSDKVKKNAAYDLLVEKLKEKDGRATRDTVTKKINNLRSSFRKECKKVLSSMKSGSGTDDVYTPSLWYYNLLLFLKEQEIPRTSVSAIEQDRNASSIAGEEEKEDLEEVPRHGTCSPNEDMHRDDGHSQKSVFSGATKRKADEDKVFVESYIMKTFAAQAAERDEHSVFGEHVANRLRKCGRSHYDTVIAQHKIENILFDLEMGAYDRNRYQEHRHYLSPQTNWQNSPTTMNDEVGTSQAIQNTLIVGDLFKSECSKHVIAEDVDGD
ncbi:uncharacterized protein LOC126995585 [Eriocheir sinensis]|uniref:uncharacterized protein LOC126995585 n=1 Tax=Eriocheir sinensis TaxID=95602 RepID=UPI0021C7A3F2|nr:uncharacterized protein LOC126995585 [Eriocheir sinensis]